MNTESLPQLAQLGSRLRAMHLVQWRGRVQGVNGQIVNVALPGARLADVCLIGRTEPLEPLRAEVVGLHEGGAYLAPLGDVQGVALGAQVESTGASLQVEVGDWMLGRIVDGFGRATVGAPPSDAESERQAVDKPAPTTAERAPIGTPFVTGVRVIDALLTCAKGQRIGIFAGAGVGKSTLLGMLLRHAQADIVVLALVGERGREVGEFVEHEIGRENMARAVIVVATSDRPAVERARACYVATTIAEHFRDQGKHVLLMVDSLTRYARAQREVGLASGEPPTRGSYPPSVFSNLPRIVERAGLTAKGCITAFYTVLIEGDDIKGDPIGEEVQSLLDGHIVLSRAIAARGQFPAVDVLKSVSRVMSLVTTPPHQGASRRFRELLAKYDQVELLVQIGEYKAGSDKVADEAVEKIAALRAFLGQAREQAMANPETLRQLGQLTGVEKVVPV